MHENANAHVGVCVSASNNDLLFPTWVWMNTNVWRSSLYIRVLYSQLLARPYTVLSAVKESSLHAVKFIFCCLQAAFLKRKLFICSSL